MLDRFMLDLSRPALNAMATRMAGRGWTADQVTFAGLGLGLAAAALVAFGHAWLALVPLLGGRLLDGLDGAVARSTEQTDRGAFLDIGFDFIFYAAMPLSFAIADPAGNAFAAAILLAAFVTTGTSFLAYAVIAEKRGLKSLSYPSKSFYYLGGLTEGTETVICFMLMCAMPSWFAILAFVYAAMCAVTSITRLAAGWATFARRKP